MEKYSQLPERIVPSSGRVRVHACKLYVTRTWMRSFTKFCPLVWSNNAVGASLREEREKGWEMFWFGLPLGWSCLRTGRICSCFNVEGHHWIYTASLDNIGGQEWVGPLQAVWAASWYRAQLHDPQIVLQEQLSSLSSQVLHNLPLLPRQWQDSPSHTAGETTATETSVVKKKNKKNPPIPLSGKLSEGWGVSFQSVQPETQPSTSRHLCALALQLLQIGLILLIWLCIKYYCWTMFAVISDRTEHF